LLRVLCGQTTDQDGIDGEVGARLAGLQYYHKPPTTTNVVC